MGYYIQTRGTKNKAEAILNHVEDSSELTAKEARSMINLPGVGIIVVIDNGPFEAAGFAYDEDELEAFLRPDGRSKRILCIPRRIAEKLSGYSTGA